jgi:hypothetical protein
MIRRSRTEKLKQNNKIKRKVTAEMKKVQISRNNYAMI